MFINLLVNFFWTNEKRNGLPVIAVVPVHAPEPSEEKQKEKQQ